MALKFRTEIAVKPVDNKISHRSNIVTIGSCFSDEVGERLRDRLFDVTVNPLGTLYNPRSIANALDALMIGRIYTADDLICINGQWHSFDHHSRFSSRDREQCLSSINSAMEVGRAALSSCSHLMVTFGTAWVYSLPDGRVVANCHKLPASQFVRSRISVESIVEEWMPLLERLHRFNKNIHVVFTVSPIRHLSDGAHGNQLSKSTLQLAVDTLMSRTDVPVEYFPAYELVLDDLRDYRFYASDMTHPSDQAVNYVYEKLTDMFFEPKTVKAASEAEKITRFAHHRPMSGAEATATQEAQLKEKLECLLTAYPEMRTAVHKMFYTI